MYCTIAQAREAGAVGSDAAVTTAIARADTLIDRYTASCWEPKALTVLARIEHDGSALLPLPPQAITSVSAVGPGTQPVIAAGAYYLQSEYDGPGAINALVLTAGGSDPLILGAEPWRGGWRGYLNRNLATGQVKVVGTWGPLVTPPEVTAASAALAAWVTGPGAALLPPGATASTPDTDDEGNAVSITVDATVPVRAARTTGLPAVDALLAPFVHGVVMIS